MEKTKIIQKNNTMPVIITMGEILLRLSPVENGGLIEAKRFDGCYGGSEGNVAIALSSMGDTCEYISVLPDNDLGIAAIRHLHRYGVGTQHIITKGDILGTYYFKQGFGTIPSKVIYNRRYSEIARIEGYENKFDFDKIFSNCKLFHISGITFALSPSCKNLCFKFLEEAKKRGISISFDFNYRSKLWTIDEAKEVYKSIISYVDYLFCSERDLVSFLGINIDSFYEKYNCKYLICRERNILPNKNHSARASIFHKKEKTIDTVSECTGEFQVLDRVGSGDAFCAGVLHMLLKDEEDIKDALNYGLNCFILKHFVYGDIFTMSEK